MRTSETTGELAAALAKAQSQLTAAPKDAQSKGPTKHKYADLDAVWEACRKPLSDNGLAVAQGVSSELVIVEGEVWGWVVRVTTTLLHSSGATVEDTLTLPAVEQKGISMAQSIGVAATYARRYGLSAMVGITQEDNDGHVGQRKKRKPTRVATEARQGKHDPSWTDEHRGFMASIAERGWVDTPDARGYELLCAELLRRNRHPRPSQMVTRERLELLADMDSEAFPYGPAGRQR